MVIPLVLKFWSPTLSEVRMYTCRSRPLSMTHMFWNWLVSGSIFPDASSVLLSNTIVLPQMIAWDSFRYGSILYAYRASLFFAIMAICLWYVSNVCSIDFVDSSI